MLQDRACSRAMGATQPLACQTPCAAAIDKCDAQAAKEWKMCTNGDESMEDIEAFTPMQMANMKMIDRERIDPWTREMVPESAAGKVAQTVLGYSPARAPLDYLAETQGKDVIVADGQDGHVLAQAVSFGQEEAHEAQAREAPDGEML